MKDDSKDDLSPLSVTESAVNDRDDELDPAPLIFIPLGILVVSILAYILGR